MAEDRIDEQIPEADLLDQRTPLVPPSPADTLIDSGPASGTSDSPGGEVDEADRLEQQTPVPGQDEDDYPPGPSGTGWS